MQRAPRDEIGGEIESAFGQLPGNGRESPAQRLGVEVTQIEIDVIPVVNRHLAVDSATRSWGASSARGWTAVMKRSPAAFRK